jgi:hypothetical protein
MQINKLTKEAFIKEEESRIKRKWGKKYNRFESKEKFATWYIDTLTELNCCCKYCNNSIFEIRYLIEKGKLIGRKCGRNGKGIRGKVLEIEKIENDKGYTPQNCTLVCYLCNNDKSSVIDSTDYLKFMSCGRKKYIDYLIKK